MAGERWVARVPVWLAGLGARARAGAALESLLRPERIAYAGLVIALALSFHWGALEHGRAVNRDYRPKDQGAYLNLAQRIAESKRIQVDGARPPLYPALVALVHDASLSREEFFERARTHSVRLTLFAWLFLLWALRRWLKPLTALAVWAAVGFPLLMFYAPYVKAEALFYVFALLSFACMLDVIHRPRLGFAAVAGVATGVAQLCKESMLPAVALFTAVQALAAMVRLAAGFLRKRAASTRVTLRRALTVPVLVGAFVITVYPHIRVNERVFGHHFYNVNSYFYIWYDSWGQVVRGTRAFGDREGFPTIPPERLPSAKKYWESHSVEQIRDRVVRGAQGSIANAARSHGFFDYACFALFAAVVAFATNERARRFARRHWPVLLFSTGYFVGYFLMCTWFFAIHPGVRFIAALAPPLIFVGAWLSDRSRFARPSGALAVFTVVAAGSLALDIPFAFWHTIERMTGSGW